MIVRESFFIHFQLQANKPSLKVADSERVVLHNCFIKCPQGVPQPPGPQVHAAHVEADPGRRLLDAAQRLQGRVPVPAVRCQRSLVPAPQQLPVYEQLNPQPSLGDSSVTILLLEARAWPTNSEL